MAALIFCATRCPGRPCNGQRCPGMPPLPPPKPPTPLLTALLMPWVWLFEAALG